MSDHTPTIVAYSRRYPHLRYLADRATAGDRMAKHTMALAVSQLAAPADASPIGIWHLIRDWLITDLDSEEQAEAALDQYVG